MLTEKARPVMERVALTLVVAVGLLMALVPAASAFDTRARAAWVYDLTTDTILLEKNADQSMPPASMSKLMTVNMLFEALKDGRVSLDDRFSVSSHAKAMEGSTMFLNETDRPTVEELIKGIVVLSGNDACVAVAEGLAGTEAEFANKMNARAQALGLTRSHFKNASGWPDPGHVMSMHDLGVLAVRLIPLLLELLARLARRPSWVAPLVALRTLARQPGAYRGPLLLLILTLSLAAFSASMAASLDSALRTAIGYQIGAQTQLLETGESTEQPGGQPQPPPKKDIQEEPRFLFVPVSDHLDVPGVTAATRVGTYDDVSLQLGGASARAQLVGIDRVDFPKVVPRFDRAWGGGQSLGALMNLLAQSYDGVLVSRDVLSKGVKIGDALPALVRIADDQRQVSFKIIGAIDLWPGFYPQDGPIVVANLDYIFDEMSGQYPYDVWIAR
jgi:hypothetical protein